MAFRTMRLTRMDRRSTLASSIVLQRSHGFNMIGIDTPPDLALVVDLPVWRNRPNKNHVGYSVSQHHGRLAESRLNCHLSVAGGLA